MNFEEFLDQYQKVPVVEYQNHVPENPLVSVCVQTYQHAPYIRECLDSILMQKTDFPFEILLGEDESNDGTRKICIQYAEKYPDKIRLFLHHRENNIEVLGKPTGRFNSLYNLYSARGEFIAFCEGDDYWSDEYKLQKQFDFMIKNPDYAICGHNAVVIENGNVINQSKLGHNQKKDYNKKEVQKGIFILTLTSFFINPKTYPIESMNVINFDTFLFIYLGKFGHYKYMGNISPAYYRKHPGGMWSAYNQKRREISDLNTYFWIAKYHERIKRGDLRDHFGRILTRKSFVFIVEPSLKNYLLFQMELLKIYFPNFTTKIKNFIFFNR